MRRRRFLRSGTAVLTAGTVAGIAGGRTGSSSDFGPLGEVELDGVKNLVMGEDREVAYVATTTGFATVDVSTPTDPRVLAERRNLLSDVENGPMRQIWDVKVDGDTLVVAGPANPIQGALNAFIVYDVSDPADPRQMAYQRTDHPIHNAFIDGDFVYLTGNGLRGNPLMVWDISEDEPTHVARWSLHQHDEEGEDIDSSLYMLHDVYVEDGYAYLAYWDAGSWILDVSDPASPEYVSHFGDHTLAELREIDPGDVTREVIEPPGNAHYPTVHGDLYAIGKESWEVDSNTDDGGPSGIDLWDVSDRTAPEKLSTIEATEVEDATFRSGVFTTAHNFEIVGDRLYSSWYQDGVKIHDVSDPAQPELLSHWRQPDEKSFWTAEGGRADEFFVGANSATNASGPASVMTFPDEPGMQADMPPIEATPTPTPSNGGGSGPTPTPTEEQTPTPTAVNGETPTAEETPTDEDEITPGFGPLAAIGGLSLVAWRYLRANTE